jgi:hypothetical protein
MPYKDLEQRKAFHRIYNNEWNKQDRLKNPAKYRQKYIKEKESNPSRRLLLSTRQSATLKKLDHNISEEDLPCPEYCPYLNIKIDYSAGNGKTLLKPSVDRIDSTKGYIKGNVEVISSLANTMKNRATPEQLLSFAKEIFKRYDGYN